MSGFFSFFPGMNSKNKQTGIYKTAKKANGL